MTHFVILLAGIIIALVVTMYAIDLGRPKQR